MLAIAYNRICSSSTTLFCDRFSCRQLNRRVGTRGGGDIQFHVGGACYKPNRMNEQRNSNFGSPEHSVSNSYGGGGGGLGKPFESGFVDVRFEEQQPENWQELLSEGNWEDIRAEARRACSELSLGERNPSSV